MSPQNESELTFVEFLKENDDERKIRVITNMNRFEQENGFPIINTSAGRDIAMYIRRRLQNIPILFLDINSFNRVKGEDLVTTFKPAGYAFFDHHVKEYIESLVSFTNDTRAWAAVRA